MDHVERTQIDIDGLADRNVDLVGCGKALRGSAKVLNFTPPLPADNCNRGIMPHAAPVDYTLISRSDEESDVKKICFLGTTRPVSRTSCSIRDGPLERNF
jgi:hypothetical protein